MMNWIRWMAGNHVAANLLMMVFVVGGIIKGYGMKQEVFPEIALDKVKVSVVYSGAGPEEVEEGILLKIEENISGIDGIDEITSTATEGLGTVLAELRSGVDANVVLQEIKSEVDRITTFPDESEKPVVSKLLNLQETVSVVVYGDLTERTLRERAEAVRDELLIHPQITQVKLSGVRPYEISIEVSEDQLRQYGVTLDQVSAAVRQASLDLPGGQIKARGGEILLRTKEKRYTGREYEDIIILTDAKGGVVRLGDIATVKDTFEETDTFARFDGKPAAMVNVYRVGDQRPGEIAEIVKAFVADKNDMWPESIRAAIWNDTSELLESRLALLEKNAALGLGLVIIVLGLFLEIRLALWVMLGIPISFFGSLLVMPMFDISINMMSLFAFILALGIVVDDAIVVGENVFSHREQGKPFLQAAIDGAMEMGIPVTFSILTTVAAFMPLAFVDGVMGKFMVAIPVVVITLLLVSLVESLFVLPAHLSSGSSKPLTGFFLGRLDKTRIAFGATLDRFILGPYTRFITLCLKYRYMTTAVGIVMLILTVGVIKAQLIQFTFMPEVDGDQISASLELPTGTPVAQTEKIAMMMMEKAMETVGEIDADRPGDKTVFRHIYAVIGGTIATGGPTGGATESASNKTDVSLFLTASEERNYPVTEIRERWREKVGEIPGAESLIFSTNLVAMGANIDVKLIHSDFDTLETAASRVKTFLGGYPGVQDIEDNFSKGKQELKFTLTPEARTMGITESDLARQIRGAFYGSEALRLQIGRNEVKVMARYPEHDRKFVESLNLMRIHTPAGGEIPITRAAYIEHGRGYAVINRTDQKRVINVMASVDSEKGNASAILADMESTVLKELMADYPGLSYDYAGEEKERTKSMGSMREGFMLAMFIIYALLAIPFRSYTQPFLIMLAIPFGMVGAVLGHLIMGYNLSMLSLFGVIALSGVVVNDSLLLISKINSNFRDDGMSLKKAVIAGVQRRFRPILLTSLTTFFGLMPMILETSVQAKFLIPMAISLGFGILFATLITLVLIPAFYWILEDIHLMFGKGKQVEKDPAHQAV